MNIGVRVEASDKIGTGHLKRCISLSLEIREHLNANIIFFFSGDDRYLELLKKHNFEFHKIKLNKYINIQVGTCNLVPQIYCI